MTQIAQSAGKEPVMAKGTRVMYHPSFMEDVVERTATILEKAAGVVDGYWIAVDDMLGKVLACDSELYVLPERFAI